jgi:putative ABC transport system permease protein
MMQRWLQDFAYRIQLSADLFILGGAIVAAVALATVAYQGVRAARMDPVASLRMD